jgi:Putative Ig domain
MANVTDSPVTFNYTGKNGYTSTVTYSYIPNSSSYIQLTIDETSPTKNLPGVVITLSPGNIPSGVKSTSYNSTTITATGGTGPYTYAITSGVLPTGLNLSNSGVISGTVASNATVGNYNITVTATDSNSNTGSRSYVLTITAAVVQPSTPDTPPNFSLTPETPGTKSFKYIKGISYTSAPINATIYTQTLGAQLVTANGQPVIINVVNADSNNHVIPKGVTVKLYDISGNILKSFYTGDVGTSGTVTSINLYYTPTSNTPVFTASISMNNQGTGWVPYFTLSATGTSRIVQGSFHANVFGPDIGNFGTGLFAGGNKNGTYLRQADVLDLNGMPLTTGQHFVPRINGQGFNNPNYGALLTSTGIPTYGPEIGYVQINSNTTGTDYGKKIIDTIIDFVIVETPLVQDPTPLELYTPYTFALTNQAVWVQTVPPYANNPNGYSMYKVDWKDGSTVQTFDTHLTPNVAAYFTHAYTVQRDTPYTVSVSAYYNNNIVSTAYLSAQFYIQNNFPEISITDYSKTLGTTPVLPYNQSDIEIGSNEWAVADNINNTLQKLDSNFEYLNVITKAIKRTPQFELVEWLADFIQYPTWNTLLSGSNKYTDLSSTTLGVAPGKIQEFKSYKSPFSAPDYYNYIIYTTLDSFSFVEIRNNDYNNTKVLTLSSFIPNSDRFNAYSVDVSGTNFYLLAQGVLNNGVTLYRYSLDYKNGNAYIVNQIGGNNGSLADPYNFGAGQSLNDIPTEIKAYNNKVYVGDKSNYCIKVYNSSLTYFTTIYNSKLSAYNVSPFDIDQKTNNIYLLGTIKAPNTPVIVSASVSATSALNGDIVPHYAITWNHDGYRLSSEYDSNSANFVIYGQAENSGGNYTQLDTVLNKIISTYNGVPKLTEYVFQDSTKYIGFKIQALGKYTGFDSELSSDVITPNKDVFPSPYSVFVFDDNSNLINTLSIPEVPPTANIIKLLVEPTGVFYYIVTDSYIYKYTTAGVFVNRINNPSLEAGSLNEPITTAFIDDNSYFYVSTATRVFKFIDLPSTSNLFNTDNAAMYYNPLSSYLIGENELIQDWVYNKSLNKVLQNHEILAKSINSKYIITVDKDNNLVSFNIRSLSGNEIITSLSATEDNFIHSNEIVSSAVINRAVDRIYNIQETILKAITPELIIEAPSGFNNVIGKNTVTAPLSTIYKYIQPLPIIVSQPANHYVTKDQNATFTFNVSSANPNSLSAQWYYNNIAITGASALSYTVLSAQLADIGYYNCTVSDNVASYTSDNAYLSVTLETLFAFASAAAIGNLYSPIPNNIPSRYGNDYNFVFDALNMPLSASLIINLSETQGTDHLHFQNSVYVTVNLDNTPIFTTATSDSTIYILPLSAYLASESNYTQPDGYPGTYSGKFSVDLTLGPIAAGHVIVPRVVASVSEGKLYNTFFRNALSAGPNYLDTATLTVYQTSAAAAYAGISNNSLGGYLTFNPYIPHTWCIDGVSSAINNNNPVLHLTPASSTSSTLSATRTLNPGFGPDRPGETEVTLGYSRTVPATVSVPRYTITGQTMVVAQGNGYVLGGGTYSAGTIVTVRNVGTYLDGNSTKLPGESTSSPLIIRGPGCYDVNTYTNYSQGTLINLRGDPGTNLTGASMFETYVDGNKTVIAYFTAHAT